MLLDDHKSVLHSAPAPAAGREEAPVSVDAFAVDTPYIPLCGWGGIAVYDRRLMVVTPTGYNPYYGIEQWQ